MIFVHPRDESAHIILTLKNKKSIGPKLPILFLVSFSFASDQHYHEDADQGEGNQRQKWNGYKAEPIDVLAIARNSLHTGLDAGKSGHFLDKIMIERNEAADDGQRKNILCELFIVFKSGYSENDGQRVHENPLEPAKLTGNILLDFTEIQTAQRGNNGHNPSCIKGKVF